MLAEGRMVKLGKRLAFGEVTLYSDGRPDPVAHVTASYSIPPERA
jgi:acyl-coenzyme A thioesterase PaaI-like protein